MPQMPLFTNSPDKLAEAAMRLEKTRATLAMAEARVAGLMSKIPPDARYDDTGRVWLVRLAPEALSQQAARERRQQAAPAPHAQVQSRAHGHDDGLDGFTRRAGAGAGARGARPLSFSSSAPPAIASGPGRPSNTSPRGLSPTDQLGHGSEPVPLHGMASGQHHAAAGSAGAGGDDGSVGSSAGSGSGSIDWVEDEGGWRGLDLADPPWPGATGASNIVPVPASVGAWSWLGEPLQHPASASADWLQDGGPPSACAASGPCMQVQADVGQAHTPAQGDDACHAAAGHGSSAGTGAGSSEAQARQHPNPHQADGADPSRGRGREHAGSAGGSTGAAIVAGPAGPSDSLLGGLGSTLPPGLPLPEHLLARVELQGGAHLGLKLDSALLHRWLGDAASRGALPDSHRDWLKRGPAGDAVLDLSGVPGGPDALLTWLSGGAMQPPGPGPGAHAGSEDEDEGDA